MIEDERLLMEMETEKNINYPINEKGNLVLSVDSDWLTHELSRLFGSIVFLHNFYAVKVKASKKEIYESMQRKAGWDIYKKANLYYYLQSNEKLKLKELHIPSPGIVEFRSNFFEYGGWLLSVLLILKASGKSMDLLVNSWYKFKDNLRKQRKKRENEELRVALETFFKQEIVPFVVSGNASKTQEEEIKIINSIKEGIILLYESNLTDPITTTDHLLTSFSTLAYFVKIKKILLEKSYVAKQSNVEK